jgi:radical SAM protein with 4Fe4S-binding SPASM domain
MDKLIIPQDEIQTENKEVDYKKEYYSLVNSLYKIHTHMCDRCPIVNQCCHGCNALKIKLKELKNGRH